MGMEEEEEEEEEEERASRLTSVKSDPAERGADDEAPARRLNSTLDGAEFATL
jgi:hypothetical protein